MTELNLLYGGADLNNDFMLSKGDEKVPKISGQQIHQMASQNMQPSYEEQLQQAQLQQAQTQQTQQVQQAQHVQVQMQQAQQMQAQADMATQAQFIPQGAAQQQANYKRRVEYSFWDRMNLKRSEVIKLALFSLVIVLGIAIDRMGTHYISKYISENILTDVQEFLLRLSYPIVVFLLLWVLKSV